MGLEIAYNVSPLATSGGFRSLTKTNIPKS